MSHILEVAEAERQRALAGGGVYGGGYCVAGQAPVLVFSSVKPAPETDAERIARLSRRVGELEYALTAAKREAEHWAHGDRKSRHVKGCGFVDVPYEGGAITVAYEEDDGHAYPVFVWMGAWVSTENMGSFGEELERLVPEAVRADYERSCEP